MTDTADLRPDRMLSVREVFGIDSDLVVLTEDLHLVSTYVGGELVHDARWSRG